MKLTRKTWILISQQKRKRKKKFLNGKKKHFFFLTKFHLYTSNSKIINKLWDRKILYSEMLIKSSMPFSKTVKIVLFFQNFISFKNSLTCTTWYRNFLQLTNHLQNHYLGKNGSYMVNFCSCFKMSTFAFVLISWWMQNI